MKTFFYYIVIIITICSCSSKPGEPELILEVKDTVELLSFKGVKLKLVNHCDRTIAIWDNINPEGFMEIYTIFEGKEDSIKIIPVVLNWRSDFSKIKHIKPSESFDFNIQITNWSKDDYELLPEDFEKKGTLKAYFVAKDSVYNGIKLWTGEISSNPVELTLKR